MLMPSTRTPSMVIPTNPATAGIAASGMMYPVYKEAGVADSASMTGHSFWGVMRIALTRSTRPMTDSLWKGREEGEQKVLPPAGDGQWGTDSPTSQYV